MTKSLFQAVAFAKLAFVAFFFASFLPAANSFAESTTANQHQCGGINLVEQLKETDPAKLEQVRAKAAKIENGSSIFWKVEKPGLEPSWLLGTMHMTDPRATKLSNAAQQALEKASTIVIESTETLDPAAAGAAMMKLKHLTFLGAGEGLNTKLDAEEMTELEARLTKRGIPVQVASLLQPWVVATMISVPVCEMAAKQSGAKILDHRIAQHALDNGKELAGLETTEEQFNAIAGLPQKFHMANLKETLAHDTTYVENMIATMKDLYQEGNIGILFPLMEALAPLSYSKEGAVAFQRAMIVERNKTMAERAKDMLGKGNAFIAVGALHLPDEHGLVHLLRDEGFTVTAVESNS